MTRVADCLQAAVNEASNSYEVGEQLRRQAESADVDEDELADAVAAFQYDFIESSEPQRRKQWGAYGPMRELTDGRVYPMPLKDVPAGTLERWSELADSSDHPGATARLNDLLWERRFSARPDQHARAAADAFVELAKGGWEPLERARALIRGLELVRAVKDIERQEAVVKEIVTAARASIKGSKWQPGVALRLIESLAWLPRSDAPEEIDALLEEAAKKYATDPWLLQSISDLQVLRAGPDQALSREINLKQIEQWREVANRAEGLVRLRHLETALELARLQGLSDVADELRKEIQQLTPADLELKTIESTVEISRVQMEKFHDAFLSGDDWAECLNLFGSYGPPSGNYEENLRTIEDLQREHPLQFLFGKVILGPGNIPIRHASTEAEHREVELSEHEARAISFWALSASHILDRINKEKDQPTAEELTEFFSSDLIAAEVAERIARSLVLYWEGSCDEAAHVLVPRLEGVVREMCRQAGMAIIREPRGRFPGGVRRLGDLLYSLRGRLDESWRRYLYNLLVDPIGINLRNRISHSLMPVVAREEAAVLLHAACFMRMLAPAQPSDESDDDAGSADAEDQG